MRAVAKDSDTPKRKTASITVNAGRPGFGRTELHSRAVYNSNLELEAERDWNEVRVAFIREHGVEARFDERLEAAQVEREPTTDVDAELRLTLADIQAREIAREFHPIQPESTDRVRPRRGGRIAE